MKRNSSVAPNRVTVLYLRKKHVNEVFLMLYFLFCFRWKVLHWNFDEKRNFFFYVEKRALDFEKQIMLGWSSVLVGPTNRLTSESLSCARADAGTGI